MDLRPLSFYLQRWFNQQWSAFTKNGWLIILIKPKNVFITGPQQVGKTTLALSAKKINSHFYCLSWDKIEHQHLIIRGPEYVFTALQLDKVSTPQAIIVFDDLHKYSPLESVF